MSFKKSIKHVKTTSGKSKPVVEKKTVPREYIDAENELLKFLSIDFTKRSITTDSINRMRDAIKTKGESSAYLYFNDDGNVECDDITHVSGLTSKLNLEAFRRKHGDKLIIGVFHSHPKIDHRDTAHFSYYDWKPVDKEMMGYRCIGGYKNGKKVLRCYYFNPYTEEFQRLKNKIDDYLERLQSAFEEYSDSKEKRKEIAFDSSDTIIPEMFKPFLIEKR